MKQASNYTGLATPLPDSTGSMDVPMTPLSAVWPLTPPILGGTQIQMVVPPDATQMVVPPMIMLRGSTQPGSSCHGFDSDYNDEQTQ